MNNNKWIKPNGPHLSGLKEVRCDMLNYELLSVIFIHPEKQKMVSSVAIFKKKTEGRSKCLFLYYKRRLPVDSWEISSVQHIHKPSGGRDTLWPDNLLLLHNYSRLSKIQVIVNCRISKYKAGIFLTLWNLYLNWLLRFTSESFWRDVHILLV